MFTATDRPTRPAEYHVFDDSPANEVLHGINGLAQEFQRGATMDGRRNAKTKRERRKREEDFAEECHSRITFMNCCEESQGES